MSKKNNLQHLLLYDWFFDMHAGGPTGYLAHLEYGLNKVVPSNKIDIVIANRQDLFKEKIKHKKKSKFSNFFFKQLCVNYFSKTKSNYLKNYTQYITNTDNMKVSDEVIKGLDFNKIKTVHAHSIVECAKIINMLRINGNRDKVKLMLTLHSPEAPHIEMVNDMLEMGFYKRKLKNWYKASLNLANAVINETDIMVFPSKESMEPLYETMPLFSNMIKYKDIRYVKTGIKQVDCNISKNDARKLLNIDVTKDQLVVAFIGRHNSIKGYDIFVETAKKILQDKVYENKIVFIVAGKQSKLFKSYKHKHFIELGHCDIARVLKATDVLVSTNRSTFFDLIILEALSLGVPIIATKTGGNKTIKQFADEIILCDVNSDDIKSKITEFYLKTSNDILKIQQSMFSSYKEYFTAEKFAMNYINIIEEIYKDYGLLE